MSIDYKIKRRELAGTLKFQELFFKIKNVNDKALMRHT